MNKGFNRQYCTLYIVRHGETEWNLERRLQGQRDSPLTKNGVTQAASLGIALKNIKFDAIYASDLLRAKRTAEIVSLERKLAVKTTDLLREHNYGRYEGKKIAEVKDELKDAFDEYDRLSDQEKFRYQLIPNAETDEEIAIRFITFIREIAVLYKGKNVLVVSHGGIMSAFLVRIGFGIQEKIRIANAGYFKLLSDGIDFTVKETVGINSIK